MQFRIADMVMQAEGVIDDYTLRKFAAYRMDTEEKPDFILDCSLADELAEPEDRVLKGRSAWHWVDTLPGEGYQLYQKHPAYPHILASMCADNNWTDIKLTTLKIEERLQEPNGILASMGMGEAFSYALLKKGGLALHASSVSYRGQAVLFSASPGTGKSTHASLWKKFYDKDVELFNDDMPALRRLEDGWYAYGTPWSGKTDINLDLRVPLQAIVMLRRGKENTICPVKGAAAFSYLREQLRRPASEELMKMTAELICRLAEEVPIYLLTCDISREAVDLVKNTVF